MFFFFSYIRPVRLSIIILSSRPSVNMTVRDRYSWWLCVRSRPVNTTTTPLRRSSGRLIAHPLGQNHLRTRSILRFSHPPRINFATSPYPSYRSFFSLSPLSPLRQLFCAIYLILFLSFTPRRAVSRRLQKHYSSVLPRPPFPAARDFQRFFFRT